jgi:WD40 repeat protein
VPTLQLLQTEASPESHGDEVLACAYSPDSSYVLSGGWDGCLRVWDAQNGAAAGKLEVSPKAVSACAVSPDGSQLLCGTVEGMLSRWDAGSHRQDSMFLAHTRPISAIAFSPDERVLATASWDRSLILWRPTGQDPQTLSGHSDIVAGCCFTPNAQTLLSWSHDNTIRLWDVNGGQTITTLKDLTDRPQAGCASPDSRWGAFGARDGSVKLFDLVAHRAVRSIKARGEIRCCMFLLDAQTLVVGDDSGRLGLYSVPDLKDRGELDTGLVIQSGALAPSSAQIALGCNDGCVHLVAIEGFDEAPLTINMTQQSRRSASALQRLFGKSSEVFTLVGTCPVCRAAFEFPGTRVELFNCPNCRRSLRLGTVMQK